MVVGVKMLVIGARGFGMLSEEEKIECAARRNYWSFILVSYPWLILNTIYTPWGPTIQKFSGMFLDFLVLP